MNGDGHDRNDVELSMTFLQFCPACEKQIPISNISILYCSESCRRKDGTRNCCSTPPAIVDVVHEPEYSVSRNIVPRRKPSTFNSFSSKPSVIHHAKADLDPTEWKPDADPCSDISTAAQFLSQFHRRPCALFFNRRAGFTARFASHNDVLSLLHSSTCSTPARSVASYSEGSIPGTPNSYPLGSSPLIYFTSSNRIESNDQINGYTDGEPDISLLKSERKSGQQSTSPQGLGAARKSLEKLLGRHPL